MENEFIEKTKSVLTDYDNDRLSPRGFDVPDFKYNQEGDHCVLIIGLNPAGDEHDAERERENRTYLCGIDGISRNSWVYNPYFSPILDLINSTVKGGAKWAWCNLPRVKIEQEIEDNADLHPYREKVLQFYNEHKNDKYTIYIGDMFYYHETNSKKLPKREDVDYHQYCKEMLELHIKVLRSLGKIVDYVYINNAEVSRWLCGNEEDKTFERLFDTYVFYGCILSGGRMDSFSNKRLKDEIKSVLKL